MWLREDWVGDEGNPVGCDWMLGLAHVWLFQIFRIWEVVGGGRDIL